MEAARISCFRSVSIHQMGGVISSPRILAIRIRGLLEPITSRVERFIRYRAIRKESDTYIIEVRCRTAEQASRIAERISQEVLGC